MTSFIRIPTGEAFLKILSGVVSRFNWLCHAFCLMDNHYHLLIETPDGNLSKGMRQLNGVYTQKYNWMHQKEGHVFQGRYKAILVEKRKLSAGAMPVCCFKSGSCGNDGETGAVAMEQLSFYRRDENSAGLFNNRLDFRIISSKKTEAEKLYQKFVTAGIGLKSPWKELPGQILLGEERFVDSHRDLLQDKQTVKEVSRIQRYLSRPKLSTLFLKKKQNRTG